MRVVVLGSGTSIPRPGRAPSGVLVCDDGDAWLLDGGGGSLGRMVAAGTRLEDLDGVLYSHLHVDHTGELAPILFALNNPDFERPWPLEVHGPPGLGALVEGLRAAWQPWLRPPPCGLTIAEWPAPPEPVHLDGWEVLARPVAHGGGAHGLRITSPSGARLCYSGDTDECDAIVELGAGVDLMVLECSHADAAKVDGHLSPSACGRIAAAAAPATLLLTHFYPGWEPRTAPDAVRAAGYGGPVILAADGLRVDV